MKYLVLTDIHGSSKYLKQVLNKVNVYDKLIILGDILYHGPRNDLPNEYNPKEVITILNENKEKIIAVRGNCDADVDLMVLDFKIENHLWMNIDGVKFLITHGHIYNKSNVSLDRQDYYMLYGHYHVNEVNVYGNITCINLGSLSIPKDGHYSYAIIEDGVYRSYDLFSEEKLVEVKINEK